MRKTLALLLIVCAVSVARGQKYESFLTKDQAPNGVNYLPAPPDTASVLFYGDYAQYQWGKSMRATQRGQQAAQDAVMDCETILRGFADSFGMTITAADTPELYRLCNLVESDACNSTSKAKKHWMRKRPFVQFSETTLIPEEEASHRHSGSFPSSHSATGWALALILTEINPDAQDAILRRGYEFGQSRVIAGYHYQSDVDAARLTAAAMVARLHADAAFQKQMEKAKKEYHKMKNEE